MSEAGKGRTLARDADVDGLRAVAALSIVGFHALAVSGITIPLIGYAGVAGFFALSGYLVTRLLDRERARTGEVDLVAFWARRVLRLFPALALVVVAVWWVVRTPHALEALMPWSNYLMVTDDALTPPLSHVWSIALEAQLYLLWPFVPRIGPRPLLVAAVVLTVAGAFVPAWWAYYWLPFRAGPFLVGAAVARSGRPRMQVRALETLAPIGLRSYGLYLWHWPLIVLFHDWVPVPILIAAAFIAAWLSFRYIEAPAMAMARSARLRGRDVGVGRPNVLRRGRLRDV